MNDHYGPNHLNPSKADRRPNAEARQALRTFLTLALLAFVFGLLSYGVWAFIEHFIEHRV